MGLGRPLHPSPEVLLVHRGPLVAEKAQDLLLVASAHRDAVVLSSEKVQTDREPVPGPAGCARAVLLRRRDAAVPQIGGAYQRVDAPHLDAPAVSQHRGEALLDRRGSLRQSPTSKQPGYHGRDRPGRTVFDLDDAPKIARRGGGHAGALARACA